MSAILSTLPTATATPSAILSGAFRTVEIPTIPVVERPVELFASTMPKKGAETERFDLGNGRAVVLRVVKTRYGRVNYHVKKGALKIKVADGLYMSEPVQWGNGKLPKTTGTTAMRAGYDCGRLCDPDWLCPGCYAHNEETRYPGAANKRTLSRVLWEIAPDRYISAVVDEIRRKAKRNSLTPFRFHESGDVFSLEYALGLAEICHACPDQRFYTYTHRGMDSADIAPLLTVGNLNIVDSNPLGMGNYSTDPIALFHAYRAAGISACMCPDFGTNSHSNGVSTCMHRCFACAHRQHVLFGEHA